MDFDPAFKAELLRMRRKLDGISGPGVRHSRDSIYIGTPQPPRTPQRRPFRVFRMIVTDSAAAPDVVLAKPFDGVSAGEGPAVPVRVYWARAVDEELYVFTPEGGTDAIYNGHRVPLLELFTLGTPEFQGMGIFAVSQEVLAFDFTRAYALPE